MRMTSSWLVITATLISCSSSQENDYLAAHKRVEAYNTDYDRRCQQLLIDRERKEVENDEKELANALDLHQKRSIFNNLFYVPPQNKRTPGRTVRHYR